MYKKTLLFTSCALIGVSCQNDKNKNIVQERYIHKYGYDVSQEEWHTHTYPGQILTTKRNGQVIIKTFEDNHLHGPTTTTWPHSQTIKTLEEYSKGTLTRHVDYSIRGTPEKESLYLSKGSVITTKWYPSGTPFSKETYKDNILISGEYYSPTNEIDTKIENGDGERSNRDFSGTILSKQIFKNHKIIKETKFHPNMTPRLIVELKDNQKHGEYRLFSDDGAPLKVEHYNMNEKHGLCIDYQNGSKYLQTEYVHGLKHGIQKRFVDGQVCIETVQFNLGQRHGPTVVYCDGSAKTSWHFNNQLVSKAKYEELVQRDNVIAAMQK